MLRLGDRVRLTSTEIEHFTAIAGFAPCNVRSVADLDAYVDQCKRYYRGDSRELRLVRDLIERGRRRCLRAVT